MRYDAQYTTEAVQSRLAALGFDPGPIDGIGGARTDAAIVAFKRSVGLRARPYLGPITLRALFHKPNAELPWMAAGMAVRGLHEGRNTARLRRWFDSAVAWIDPREIPWCGAFIATCYRKWRPEIELTSGPLGARSWSDWGQPCSPRFGALLVFWRGSRRGWKGHVGYYVGEDATHFHVLGGNQRDRVSVTRIRKSRLLASRWPSEFPISGGPVRLTSAGVPVTENEA